eukprot:PITA_12988
MFVLMSDNNELRYLFDQLNLDVRKARWLATINELNFAIRYIKGKENKVVDSQKESAVEPCCNDVDYHLMEDGLVRFRDKIYVLDDSELKKLILREFHVNRYPGHPGYQKTLTTVKKFYYWPNLKKEVVKFMARCLDCQQLKAKCKHPDGLL